MTVPGHVVVVGGGITGLVAAYRLSQAGVEVTVIEPDRLGGKLQTSMVAGRPVDETADAFLLRVPWALTLCHDLELDGELISPAERTAHLYLDGARRPLPGGHVMGVPTDLEALAASGIVSAEGVERARQDLTLPADPQDPGPLGDDVAIGPYLRRRLGDEVVDRLIDPLLGGINAGDTATMSLAAVVPQLDAAARSGDPSLVRSCISQRNQALATGASPEAPIFATPIGGVARLIDALLARMPGVDIREGRRVEAIERRVAPGIDRVLVALDDGSTVDADAVIVTCPAHAAGPLLAEVSPDASSALTAIDHSSIAMATMAFAGPSLGDVTGASGCLVPRDQGMLVTAVSYATSKWAQLRDPDQDDVILRTSVGRSGDGRFTELDDAELTDRILAELDQIIGVTAAPTEVRLGRWMRSFPQYAPGHLDRMSVAEASLADSPVRLAGMAMRGVGIPACIHSAEQAVTSLGVTWPTRRSLR